MNNYMIGILFVLFGIILFIGVMPSVAEMFDDLRGCSYFNCDGYVMKNTSVKGSNCSVSNQDYSSVYDTNNFGCTTVELGPPLLILGTIIAGIVLIMYGRREQEQIPMAYGGY